jgi:hypothetical protein
VDGWNLYLSNWTAQFSRIQSKVYVCYSDAGGKERDRPDNGGYAYHWALLDFDLFNDIMRYVSDIAVKISRTPPFLRIVFDFDQFATSHS